SYDHETLDNILCPHEEQRPPVMRSWEADPQWSLDLIFLPDSHTLAFTQGEAVALLDTRSGEKRPGPETRPYLQRLAVSPDGTMLVVRSSPYQLTVWSLQTNARLFAIASGDEGTDLLCADFSPDGRLLVVGCRDGAIRLWSLRDQREIAVWPGPQSEWRGI